MNSFEDDVEAKDGCSTILDTIMKLTSQVSTKLDANVSGNSFYSERGTTPTSESEHTNTVNDILSESMEANQDSSDKDCIKSNINNSPRLMPDLEDNCLIKETESTDINNSSTLASAVNVHENIVTDEEEKVSEKSVNGSTSLSEESLWSGREDTASEVEKHISTDKNSNSLRDHPNSTEQESADRISSEADGNTDVSTQHREKIEGYHIKNLLKPDSPKVNDSFVSSANPKITCEVSDSDRISKPSEKNFNHENLKFNSSKDLSPTNTKSQTLQCTDLPLSNLSHSLNTESEQTSIESKQCLDNPVPENSQDFIPPNTSSESSNSEKSFNSSQPKREILNIDKTDVISLQENSNGTSDDGKIELKNLIDGIVESPKHSTMDIENTHDSEESIKHNSKVYVEKDAIETFNSQLNQIETTIQEENTEKLSQSGENCTMEMKEKASIPPKNLKTTADASSSFSNIRNDDTLSSNNSCLHPSSTHESDTKNLLTEEVGDDFKILKKPENDLEDNLEPSKDVDTKVANTDCPAKDVEEKCSTVLNKSEEKESVCENVLLKTVSSSLELNEELNQKSITCSEGTKKVISVSHTPCSTNGVRQENVIDQKSLDGEPEKSIVPIKRNEEVEVDERSTDVVSPKLCDNENSDAKLITGSNTNDKENLERVIDATQLKQNEVSSKDEISPDISSNLSKESINDNDDESVMEDIETQSTAINSAQTSHDEATKRDDDNPVDSFTDDHDINTLERKLSIDDKEPIFSYQGKRKRDLEEEDDSSSNSKSSSEGKRKRDKEEEDDSSSNSKSSSEGKRKRDKEEEEDISSKRTKTDSESSLPEDIYNEDESSHSIIIGEAFTINEEQMKEFDDASDCDVKPSNMSTIPVKSKEEFTSESQDDSQDSGTKNESIFKESLLRTTKKVGQGGLKTSQSPSKISGKAKTKAKRSALFTPKKRKKQSDFSRKSSDFVSPTSPVQRRYDVLPAFLQEIAAIDPSLVVFRERLNEEGAKVRVSCIVFHESILDWAFVETLLSSFDNTKSLRSRSGSNSRWNILFPESSTMESKIDLFHPVHLEKSFPFAMPNVRTRKEEKPAEMKLPFPLEQLSLLCPSSLGRRDVIKPDGKSGSLQAVTFADEPLEWAFKETFLSSFEDAPILSDLLGLSSSTRKWPDVAEEILANENVDFSFPFACPTSRRNFENLLFGELSFSLPSSLLHETLQLPPLPADLERGLYGERDALVRLLALASFYKHISYTPTVRSNRKLSISHSALISSFRPLIISQANNFAFCIKDVRARLLKGVTCQDGSIIPALIKGPMHTRRGFIFSNVQKLEAAVSKDPNNKLQYA